MTQNYDLRDAARQLRQVAPSSPGSRGRPPQENGERLATIARGTDEQLRLSWAEYNGANFLNLRVWKRIEDGWWPERGKGLTVRMNELADFAEGVAAAMDAARKNKAG